MNRNRQGSVLLLTLFLIVLAAFAMSRFIEKAYGEILAEAVYMERDRLRLEAYSALESTIAVLYNVERMAGALHDPAQGWDDPLWLAGVELSPGINVQVEFVDEMGKISLPSLDRDRLLRLFEMMDFDLRQAEELTEALLGWMSETAAEGSFAAHHLDYERADLPFRPPYRSLRSFYELTAVAGFRDAFFDSQGVPNERFHQFTSLVSLYRFDAINVNSVSPGVLRVWSDLGEVEMEQIATQREHFIGEKPYFDNLGQAQEQFGIPLGQGFGVATHAVRVNITVTEGTSKFALSTVVAPTARAESLRPVPADGGQEEQPRRARSRRERTPVREPSVSEEAGTVPYPYTFLELRENETIL